MHATMTLSLEEQVNTQVKSSLDRGGDETGCSPFMLHVVAVLALLCVCERNREQLIGDGSVVAIYEKGGRDDGCCQTATNGERKMLRLILGEIERERREIQGIALLLIGY